MGPCDGRSRLERARLGSTDALGLSPLRIPPPPSDAFFSPALPRTLVRHVSTTPCCCTIACLGIAFWLATVLLTRQVQSYVSAFSAALPMSRKAARDLLKQVSTVEVR